MSKPTFQQKTKLMAKLFDSGCNTEKKLQQLDMESILKIPGITIPDMALIIELQKETKANKLLSTVLVSDICSYGWNRVACWRINWT